MDIRKKVEQLSLRLLDTPQYQTQGAVLFVDLERRNFFSRYLPLTVLRTFLTGRGANMYLLYNLLIDGIHPLHPGIPLIFGNGALTGSVPTAKGSLERTTATFRLSASRQLTGCLC
jgi:aldehyde:ferredoxin oxidoreductase